MRGSFSLTFLTGMNKWLNHSQPAANGEEKRVSRAFSSQAKKMAFLAANKKNTCVFWKIKSLEIEEARFYSFCTM